MGVGRLLSCLPLPVTKDRGIEVELSQRAGLQSRSPKLPGFKFPTLRFRGKIMLGFAVVLAIAAASMGFAYLGFEGVSNGVATYRKSVAEADLARNIDRELISYRGLARYYVITGTEDDSKAALKAEAALKDAIDQAMKGTTNPGALDQITKLAREFTAFTKIFADIIKVKSESALVAQNQLTRGGTMLRYKLDDLASTASDDELPAVELGAKQVASQYQAMTALANTFVINSDVKVANSALARIKFVENSLHAISTTDDKIVTGLQEAAKMLDEYKQALGKLIENSKEIDELTGEMADSAAAIVKGSGAMKADLASDQQRLEAESDATIVKTQNLILMLAAGGFLLGAALAIVLGKGISRAAGPRPQGRGRRNGRRGGGVQAAGGGQGRARCRGPGSAQQGLQRGAARRADSLRRRIRDRGRRHRLQRFGLRRAA